MRYLLDTNILSDLVRNPSGASAQRLAEVGPDSVCTSIIAAAELRFGAAKRNSRPLTTQVERLLEAMDVLPLEPPADAAYAGLRTDLEQRGLTIGANDMLIAAHALALGLVLVSDNLREFERIAGLRLENWIRGG